MRLDTPTTSVISVPAAQKTILLDHLKKEAIVIPTPPAAAAPGAPGAPKPPATAAQPPSLQVQELGKSTIEGHEVEGKRFIFTPPPMPQAPPKPQAPAAPKVPGLPASAAPPKPAQPPKPLPPTVTEVWTSVKLKTPILTKMSQPCRRANHLLQAHFHRRAASLRLRNPARIQVEEILITSSEKIPGGDVQELRKALAAKRRKNAAHSASCG